MQTKILQVEYIITRIVWWASHQPSLKQTKKTVMKCLPLWPPGTQRTQAEEKLTKIIIKTAPWHQDKIHVSQPSIKNIFPNPKQPKRSLLLMQLQYVNPFYYTSTYDCLEGIWGAIAEPNAPYQRHQPLIAVSFEISHWLSSFTGPVPPRGTSVQ